MSVDFELMAEELQEKLRKPIALTEHEIVNTWTFQDTANGIKNNPAKRHGRTDEEIDQDVLSGKAAEIGIARLLGVTTFDVEWDENDRASYAKDVVYNDIRIEVKSTYYRTHFSIPSHSFNTLTGHADRNLIDVLVFAHVQKESTGFLSVTPTLIVDPYPEGMTFRGLWDLKNGERGGFTYVYPALQAHKRELCYPLVEI